MTTISDATEFMVKALSANTATSGGVLRPEAGSLTKVTPSAGESQDAFVSRCMSSLKGEFPDQKQRVAACHSMWRQSVGKNDEDREFSTVMLMIENAGVRRKIQQLSKRIDETDLAEDGFENEPHITVKFGLHTDDADDVSPVISKFGTVQVTLGKTSIFETRGETNHDVVKVDVRSERLRELNSLVSKSLPCTDTYPTYKPHLTIAYVKPGLGKKYAGLSDLFGTEVRFDSATFSGKDKGARTKIPLGKIATFKRTSSFEAEEESDHTFVYGAALVPDEPDFQGDVISAAEIQKVADRFVERYQNVGLMHEYIVRSDAVVFTEFNVAKVPHTLGTTTYPVGTWFLGAKVYDPQLRKAVLAGQLSAWSIGGEGNRNPIPAAE